MATNSEIPLYTTNTPNGIKVSILLEELGLEYKVIHSTIFTINVAEQSLTPSLQVVPIKLAENTQKEPWFLEINPNGRIPALTDTWTDGKPIRVFESGAILEYLVDRYDKDHKVSYPRDSREHWEVTSWVNITI